MSIFLLTFQANPSIIKSDFRFLGGCGTAEIEERTVPLFKPDINSLRERFKTAKPKNIHEMYEMIFRGGMPKLATTDIDRDRFYADYINTYLERDIRQLSQVEKLNEFYDFLVFIAARTAHIDRRGYSFITKSAP